MSSGGWIKLYRSIEDNFLSDNKPYDYTHAWIWLIMKAQSKDKEILFNNQLMKIRRGDCLTSVRKMANVFGWSRAKVMRFLNILEETKMIQIKSDEIKKNGTLLSIVNYGFFQGEQDTQKTPKRHQQGHPKDNYRDSHEDTYVDSHEDSDLTQTRSKEVKNKEKIYKRESDNASSPLGDSLSQKTKDELIYGKYTEKEFDALPESVKMALWENWNNKQEE